MNELPDLLTYDSQLIYGQAKPAAPKPFVPGFVQNDKKVSRFDVNIPKSKLLLSKLTSTAFIS